MSCSPFDIRDYFLKELADPQQRQVEAHVKTCAACGEELDRLRITHAALYSIADEEIPQRIAFVSDKIFEPSPWRRWLTAFWGSGARLGFASAAMVSAAILVSALTRPAPAPAAPIAMAPTQAAVVSQASLSESEINRRIQVAVEQAVTASEGRQQVKLAKMETELKGARQSLYMAADEVGYVKQQLQREHLQRYTQEATR